MRRLEEDCGAALFERAGRGIRLTAAGKVLLKWAQRMRFDVEDAKREIAGIGAGLAGHVRIGIVPTAAQFVLPAVARQLLHEAPAVTLRTVVGLVDTLRPLLHAGEIDMMVGTEIAAEAGYKSKLLAVDAIVVAASANHEVFREDRPTLKSLTAVSLGPATPRRADARLARSHVRPQAPCRGRKCKSRSTMLLMLPTLIEQTGLLSFISRHHLVGRAGKVGAQGGSDQGGHDAPAPRGDLSGQQLPVAGGGKAHRVVRGHSRRCRLLS